MSSGSSLYLIRKIKGQPSLPLGEVNDRIRASITKHCQDYDQEELIKKVENIGKQKFVLLGDHEVIDTNDRTVYEISLSTGFSSSFTSLSETLGLTAYDNTRNQCVLTQYMASWMKQAIDWLVFSKLCGYYDKKSERILENEYIKVFGDCLTSYGTLIFDDKDELEEIGFNTLKDFKTVLDAYFLMSDEYSDYEHVLLYTRW